MSATLPGWVKEFFGPVYAETVMGASQPPAQAVASLLNVGPGSRVLDQCCGIGALALGLARLGVRVVSVDQNKDCVAGLRQASRGAGLPVVAVVADAGPWRPAAPLDAAVSWFSSLGYSGPDGAARLLAALHAAVRPGGRWLVEVGHRAHLDARFEPVFTTTHPSAHGPAVWVRRHSTWDADVLVQDWVIGRGAQEFGRWANTRCWQPSTDALCAAVEATGSHVRALHGTAAGTPLTEADQRLVLVAECP